MRALTLPSSNEEMRVKSVAEIVLGFKDQVSLCFFLFDIRRLNVCGQNAHASIYEMYTRIDNNNNNSDSNDVIDSW